MCAYNIYVVLLSLLIMGIFIPFLTYSTDQIYTQTNHYIYSYDAAKRFTKSEIPQTPGQNNDIYISNKTHFACFGSGSD